MIKGKNTKKAIPIDGLLCLVPLFIMFALMIFIWSFFSYDDPVADFLNGDVLLIFNNAIPIVLLVLSLITFYFKNRIFVYIFGLYLVYVIILFLFYFPVFIDFMNFLFSFMGFAFLIIPVIFIIMLIIAFILLHAVFLIYLVRSKQVKATFMR